VSPSASEFAFPYLKSTKLLKPMNPYQWLCLPMLVIGSVMPHSAAKAAQSLPLDGTWVELIGMENQTVPYIFPDGPWVLSPTAPVRLTVTDWKFAGDLFEVYDNGVLLGTGSNVAPSGGYAATPDEALGNPRFSQNSWILQPGDHSIMIRSTRFAPTFTNGSIAFRAELAPDGGATIFLLGMALTGMVAVRAFRGPAAGGR
jgi:hypothetical protein